MFVAICILSGRDTKVNTIAVSRSEKAAIDALIDFLVDNYLLVDWTLADPEKSKYENHFFILKSFNIILSPSLILLVKDE